jgi:hypothetical protein
MPVEIMELIMRARVNDEPQEAKATEKEPAAKQEKDCNPLDAMESLQELLRRKKER